MYEQKHNLKFELDILVTREAEIFNDLYAIFFENQAAECCELNYA